jgi:hypothetical protein
MSPPNRCIGNPHRHRLAVAEAIGVGLANLSRKTIHGEATIDAPNPVERRRSVTNKNQQYAAVGIVVRKPKKCGCCVQKNKNGSATCASVFEFF